ncbi:hypothetical protein N8540_03700 [Gammaproteobacteria bacterium]|nr:hypothetical protein [Gammaproteobacteria bacterium]MDC1512335.1 hypothetical protein [Gammaproteobacteria bacterium]
MRDIKSFIVATAFGALTVVSSGVMAQAADGRFLSLTPPEGLPVVPVMEGWVANEDGTASFSMGFLNKNKVGVDIPLGPNNYIEPAKYDGQQPTYFPPGRGAGSFAITVPADEINQDVWWYLKTGDGEMLKIPGRYGESAYELDFIRPRPAGSMQPLVGFGEDGAQAAGLTALMGAHEGTVTVGQQIELAVNVSDPSMRDTSDPRFKDPFPVGVHFNKYQGPGAIEFARHESTPEPVNPYTEDNPRFRFYRAPGANEVSVEGGIGIARVYATFNAPGEYVVIVKAENFRAPDSQEGDQCCWTNVYQKVTVAP